MILLPLFSALAAAGLANAQCNPMQTKCPTIPGLATKEYSIDFTKETKQPSNWTLADQAVVNYGGNGAEFTFAKRFDAPYIWSSFYFLFGKVEVVAKAAKGTGIVTGAVLMSDCLDEIDWEWSGSNFGSKTGKVQTNVFGKGITGNYDRGTQPDVSNPTDEYHTYVLDWSPERLIWSIDGKEVRKLDSNKDLTGNYQYPQTPSRLHLGIWNGGDANSSDGVVQWVGGKTDLAKVPYTAYVKSVKITNQNPCSSWQYPEGFKGEWTECKCTNETIASPTPTAAPKPTNLPCTYTVSTGDYGYGIADKLHVTFSELNSANNGTDWDKLLLGQILKVPGGNCSNSTAPNNSTATQTPLYTNTTTSSTPTGTGQACVYYVAPGDNGYSVAEKVHVSFSDLNDANPVDWDKILVGQGLKIPGSKCFPTGNTTSTATAPYMNTTSSLPPYANTTTPQPTSSGTPKYLVCEGDYGYKIAEKLGCTFDDLNKANPGCDWDKLLIGQELNVCKNTPANNTNVVIPGQSTGPTATAQNGTALSTMTVKPSGSKASDINEICVIKTTTLCPSTPVANMNKTTTTAIYTNGSITVVPTTISTPKLCEYTVVQGDYGYKIAESLGVKFDDLNKANPNQDWDKLIIGQILKVPGDQCGPKTTSTQTATSTQTHTVVVGKNGTTTVPPQTPASSGIFSAPATNVNVPSNPGTTTPVTTPGTSASQSSSSTSTTPPPVCNHDNCYNNMVDKRYSTSVGPFCSMFMAPGNASVPIPTYLGGCQTKSERVSSACKCIMTSPLSSSTSSTSSASTSGSSSGPLTSTGSSTTSSGTLGTTATTVITTGSTDTVLTSSGTTPATLGTTATTDSSASTTPGTTPETLGTTSSTSSTSESTTGTTSTSEATTGTTSGTTSSTTPGTSSSSSSSSGTLGTTASTSSTTGTSSTTTGTSTPPTTSSSSSSSSSSSNTPPTTSTGSTSSPSTPPPSPSTPPTTTPPTTTQPPKTPPTTSSTTTNGGGWGDWNGGSGGGGSGWNDWNGSPGGMDGDSGRGGQGSNKDTGGNAKPQQDGHHKRTAEADAQRNPQNKNSGSGGQGGGGFLGKFGWRKRSAAAEMPSGAGSGNMGQGSDSGPPMGAGSQGSAPQGHPSGQGMPGAGSAPGSGSAPGGKGSGGFFGKLAGGWKRSPQDDGADTPGGAQGRSWGKVKRGAQADDAASGTVTKTKVNTATNVVTANAGASTGAVSQAAATGAAEQQGYPGTLVTSGKSVSPVVTGTGRENAAANSAAGVEEQGYQGTLSQKNAAAAAATGAAATGSAGGSNNNVVNSGSYSSGSTSGSRGSGAGAGDMGREDMAGSGGWGAWIKDFAGTFGGRP